MQKPIYHRKEGGLGYTLMPPGGPGPSKKSRASSKGDLGGTYGYNFARNKKEEGRELEDIQRFMFG